MLCISKLFKIKKKKIKYTKQKGSFLFLGFAKTTTKSNKKNNNNIIQYNVMTKGQVVVQVVKIF